MRPRYFVHVKYFSYRSLVSYCVFEHTKINFDFAVVRRVVVKMASGQYQALTNPSSVWERRGPSLVSGDPGPSSASQRPASTPARARERAGASGVASSGSEPDVLMVVPGASGAPRAQRRRVEQSHPPNAELRLATLASGDPQQAEQRGMALRAPNGVGAVLAEAAQVGAAPDWRA